ncbi:MAG: hypothetical protein HOF01_06795 [Chloroflexi bacterium]|jgi:hypothetical protein|nr:hypothetical protein [Chloroflexota bacterium]
MPFSKAPWGVFLRTAGSRLAFGLTLVLLLAVACSSTPDSETMATPNPTSTISPTQEPVPTAVIEPAELTVEDLLAEIERGIEDIRGIDTPPPAEYNFVDQDGMRARLAEELNDPETLEQIAHESALFKLLGLIPQDADLGEIYDSLFGSQVLGLYDPEKEEFFVLGDDQSGSESLDVEAQLTYAHEYVHRLQDAKFDLDAVKELATGDDMGLAISALVEGDATSAQSQYMLANYDFAELSELLESALASQEDLPDTPYFLQQTLEFSYTEGAAFISIILQLGQFAAVDAVFVDPPKSTEQIMHPEKYFDKEDPIEIDIPDDAMRGGWTVQAENVMGEFFLRTWLEALGSENATAAAAGWGGDAYAVYEDSSSGETGLAVTIAWDTSDDSTEFFKAITDAMGADDNYSAVGDGIPGVLESWKTPGGYMVISRWTSDDVTDRIAIGIGSSVDVAKDLQLAGAHEYWDGTEITILD